MAMLFDHPLDDFTLDDHLYSNHIDHNFWDFESEKLNLGSLLPTPPLSPDQQLELKHETEAALDTWNTDAEVECYLSYNQPSNNIIINDKIWCDDKVFTPTELQSDSFLKLKTPTLDDLVSHHHNRIRPITPPTPIKIEMNALTPIKVESPMKPRVQKMAPQFKLGEFTDVRIKDEPLSPPPSSFKMFYPPPIKSSTEASFFSTQSDFSSVDIKDEPVECVPPKPDIRVRVSVKEESSFDFVENKQSELVLKERRPRQRTGTRPRNSKQLAKPDVAELKYEDVKPVKREVRVARTATRSDSMSGSGEDYEDHIMSEVYLKRKLAEISDCSSSEDGLLSPKRRLSQSQYSTANSVLAEEAAEKLTLDQLRNLTSSHSHREDEDCNESCTKRFAHNVLERKRRNDLKRSYQILQAEVPDISETDRVAKVVILKKSAEYIKKVEEEDQELRAELRQVRNHQRQLIEKFRLLFKLTQQNASSK